MANNNEQMIDEIRGRLNLVNQSVIDPVKFKTANEQEIREIYDYVTSKASFTPSEASAIAEALGQIRQ
ncbi:DUF1128 domain-containing protein [Staphylococcus pseudoxylosus]|uniref:DUF1128 family protein n=1 Tax=Staphylococcus pseudoxylosus TaxID=2282419 RepID=UPI000D1D247B|nr:DUF1128 family protein [Staphylococcus pseudoxylosus]PTI45204.1 DUF1128 domain-containing protein [Staphylococcus xylosus]MEB6037752.1 DUF1128 domain-containing protein [Staphylococcus pseudoxylosus]MEB6061994.1 DUF1128 domain-containing protein [Staphylococcus pseudoxylosus]MEB7765019.1 DUF1128 domain-containing protein [Staphylococcus pseudoxylosus]MEB8087909.1 DUF1128 domain-containing protein [Staphylococcus pseudoxylosus]